MDVNLEHRYEKRDVKVNIGHVFCQTFNRDVLFGSPVEIIIVSRQPSMHYTIPRFRVIERFCIESSNKRSDHGALQ